MFFCSRRRFFCRLISRIKTYKCVPIRLHLKCNAFGSIRNGFYFIHSFIHSVLFHIGYAVHSICSTHIWNLHEGNEQNRLNKYHWCLINGVNVVNNSCTCIRCMFVYAHTFKLVGTVFVTKFSIGSFYYWESSPKKTLFLLPKVIQYFHCFEREREWQWWVIQR